MYQLCEKMNFMNDYYFILNFFNKFYIKETNIIEL